MASVNSISDIPSVGRNLIVVAAVNNVLHFRMFDVDGNVVVNTDEKSLPGQVRETKDLKKRLEGLWPPHELTGREKSHVLSAVSSVVGPTPGEYEGKRMVRALSEWKDVAGRKGTPREDKRKFGHRALWALFKWKKVAARDEPKVILPGLFNKKKNGSDFGEL
jgi:hypothetical protein